MANKAKETATAGATDAAPAKAKRKTALGWHALTPADGLPEAVKAQGDTLRETMLDAGTSVASGRQSIVECGAIMLHAALDANPADAPKALKVYVAWSKYAVDTAESRGAHGPTIKSTLPIVSRMVKALRGIGRDKLTEAQRVRAQQVLDGWRHRNRDMPSPDTAKRELFPPKTNPVAKISATMAAVLTWLAGQRDALTDADKATLREIMTPAPVAAGAAPEALAPTGTEG